MAVTAYWYAKAFVNVFGGATAGDTFSCDWLSDTIKVALCQSTYTPNQDTHATYNDLTNEVSNSGTGYTTGGVTLATKTLSNTNNVVKFSADTASWASSTITARRAVIYKSSGTATQSPLLAWVDFGADVSSSNGTFSITWDANGIMTVTPTDATGFP